MTIAGYVGMVGTLAFVLGLILLVAKLARRYLPGAVQASGTDTFSVVQRIPLGQRQGIAIVQRGDLLIGVSVGDGGVRTLFTMPNTATVLSEAAATAHVPVVQSPVVQSPVVQLPAAIDADAGFRTTGALQFPAPALVRDPEVTTEPASLEAWTVPSDSVTQFRTILGNAIRQARSRSTTVLVAALTLSGALSASSLTAQATQAPTVPARTPAAVTPTAKPAAGATPTLRTLPAAPQQAGPRDRPVVTSPQAVAPKPGTLARTPAIPGAAGSNASNAPLLPAPQARDIAALQQRAQGNAPLTTVEAQRIATRADSMLSKLAPQMELKLGGSAQNEGLRMSGTVGVVVMMGLLSLLPVLLLMMTGFTRILVVLHFLKQALGTQSAPPGQLLAAMALLLSGFVMAPTLKDVNANALEPWMDGKIEQVEMMSRAVVPFKTFMLKQVRDQDLQTFVDLADIAQPKSREEVPLTILMSAFVTSELRTAFQIGFALFLPFIVIDVVVGSVLMSMGMVMLPPAMISLPFKLLLFVLVDGWGLVITGLVQSFH
jgi:flagellar biosynthesis protein FliP